MIMWILFGSWNSTNMVIGAHYPSLLSNLCTPFLCISLHIYLSMYLPVYLSIFQFIYPFTSPPPHIHSSLFLSLCFAISPTPPPTSNARSLICLFRVISSWHCEQPLIRRLGSTDRNGLLHVSACSSSVYLSVILSVFLPVCLSLFCQSVCISVSPFLSPLSLHISLHPLAYKYDLRGQRVV